MSPAGNPVRLSLFQESIWFFRLLDPAMGSFNIGRAWSLRGPLDPLALQQALDRIAARHDILRSQVVVRDGFTCMAIVPQRRLLCQVTSFPQPDSAAARDRALAFLQDECTRQFDFKADPLVRIHLVRVAPDESILMIIKPHLITDDTSMSIFATELAELYSAIRTGKDACLSPPLQFAAYAEGQHAFCRSPEVEPHLAYWQQVLTGAPASIGLPARRAKDEAPVSPYAGGEARFSISAGLLDRLNAMRRNESATLYGVFLAAFAILLRHIADQEDIVVGGLVANRFKPSTRAVIGPLVNTFALRFRFSDMVTARDVLAAARTLVTNAYRYSDLPFERIIEDLKAQQKLDPKFRLAAVFDYFASPPATPAFHGLDATPVRIYRKRAQAGLILKVWPEAQGMAVFFEYQLALFDAANIESVFACYEAILSELARSPGAELRSMNLPGKLGDLPRKHADDQGPGDPVSASGAVPSREMAEPATVGNCGEIQSLVMSIWAKVLEVDTVGPESDFFQLGGHSLLAVQIVNRIWDELGVEVPVDLLYTDAATVRALSDYVFARVNDRAVAVES
jgi:syringomycin synthetase protein SyrE